MKIKIHAPQPEHTASSDTIFIQIYMDAFRGSRGVKKSDFFLKRIKMLSSCAKIAPQKAQTSENPQN